MKGLLLRRAESEGIVVQGAAGGDTGEGQTPWGLAGHVKGLDFT